MLQLQHSGSWRMTSSGEDGPSLFRIKIGPSLEGFEQARQVRPTRMACNTILDILSVSIRL